MTKDAAMLDAAIHAALAERDQRRRERLPADLHAEIQAGIKAAFAVADALEAQERSGEWACPKCGRKNTREFERCPVCRTRNPRRVRTQLDRDRQRARLRGFKEGFGR